MKRLVSAGVYGADINLTMKSNVLSVHFSLTMKGVCVFQNGYF